MFSNRDPSLRKSGIGNVFVKNLPKEINSKSLQEIFSQFGKILSCIVSTGKDDNGNIISNGYGFVQFENPESAEAAINELNNKYLNQVQIQVVPYKTKTERPSKSKDEFTNVYVKNLPISYDNDALKKLFEKYGEIQNAAIQLDPEGKSKGFGFVNFNNPEDAKKAVDGLNGKNIDENDKEKVLSVNRFQTKEERVQLLKVEHQIKASQKQETNLYVRHFPDDFDEAKLKDMFKEFGEIKSVRVMRDKKKYTPRGFGFVCFARSEDASRAITEMHGKMQNNNKPLYVALHQPKPERRIQLERIRREQPVPNPLMMPPAPMGYPYIQPMGYPYPQAVVWGQPQMSGIISEEERKQQLGNQLYGLVQAIDAENAAKITGMFLELDESEISELLLDDSKLRARIQEALSVLKNA